MPKPKRPQTNLEESLNSISHGFTAVASIFGFIYLINLSIKHPQDWGIFSAVVYGVSLVALYSFSSLYHFAKDDKRKKFFKILDHSGIFLLIAGSYTPILLLSMGGDTGWIFFAGQWTMAGVGIILKIFYAGKFKGASTAIYALMGWSIVLKLDLLKASIPEPALTLLALSGLAYTVGIIFYSLDSKLKYGHFIWHLFVMAGSAFHYYMLVTYMF
ncbi:MAG: hemolysin III family protein [Cyclobacteriaceae bacterium]|nr:hemolysin III family protein [Cyclobacteriaceae bacterium]